MLKVAINGFGRIGRLALRAALKKHQQTMKIVAINTSGNMEAAGWAHLFEFDSTYGRYQGKVAVKGNNIIVDGISIPLLAELEPKKLPWKKLAVDLVLECTGRFRKAAEADDHLEAGAKRVLLSAPPKGGEARLDSARQAGIYIMGLNAGNYKNDKVFSNASCTTNCVAPVAKVMVKIPTSTGAAAATGVVLPELAGIFDGIAIRVPVVTGSLTDFTFLVRKKTTAAGVNQALTTAAKTYLKGILGVTDKPVVSSDVLGCEYSSWVDLEMTRVIDGDLVKILSWYDNEWGYVIRMMELALLCR
ncbi:MAG: Glyceraldehyde-3-phosphate dehydrogenase, type I [Candidatus Beckwithbacteria bacterium GW2011_GWA2_43_10]|uniref:Glyceraldehyde-3-phosphate dehydrogenase, type I n=1 Tax=Candidatus Beckwithbacteria bacterium GW2011_GWA2_43_10 TaxID=1618369 RepID=A0A0G1C047_9BACT|nr:MAG: Glyceraldehyde-3-phosphate dehydrogenase, type I [Candidatus Beckwithbacteria bacterium GW2011_GWA2_43_10]